MISLMKMEGGADLSLGDYAPSGSQGSPSSRWLKLRTDVWGTSPEYASVEQKPMISLQGEA
jgi:hypothetical protein